RRSRSAPALSRVAAGRGHPSSEIEASNVSAEPSRTRADAIDALRGQLSHLVDGQRSLCSIVGELGVFCRGFRQWNDHEFHRRWKAVLGQSTHLTRPQIERLADLWQLVEQLACGAALPCDVPSARSACGGWSEFSDVELDRFCREMHKSERNVAADPSGR